jgi:hypothetical protein
MFRRYCVIWHHINYAAENSSLNKRFSQSCARMVVGKVTNNPYTPMTVYLTFRVTLNKFTVYMSPLNNSSTNRPIMRSSGCVLLQNISAPQILFWEIKCCLQHRVSVFFHFTSTYWNFRVIIYSHWNQLRVYLSVTFICAYEEGELLGRRWNKISYWIVNGMKLVSVAFFTLHY